MFIIAGHYRHQKLKSPKGSQTRPTSSRLREALFNICQQTIDQARFLDIFAGSGAMGLEALSRGAHSTTFIDAHHEAIRCIQANIAQLKVKDQCQVLRGEAFAMLRLLEKQNKTFDLIYADPPYRTHHPDSKLFYSQEMIAWIDTHCLLNCGGTLFIEEDCNIQPTAAPLQTLVLISSRRMGQAALHEYKRTV
ncbi:MAG: 16S rRNA (guanine(966)-N(2))-methyltransferase RsmD [Parachlamydiaceae bacterium]